MSDTERLNEIVGMLRRFGAEAEASLEGKDADEFDAICNEMDCFFDAAAEIEWLRKQVSYWEDLARKALRERDERQVRVEDQTAEINRQHSDIRLLTKVIRQMVHDEQQRLWIIHDLTLAWLGPEAEELVRRLSAEWAAKAVQP